MVYNLNDLEKERVCSGVQKAESDQVSRIYADRVTDAGNRIIEGGTHRYQKGEEKGDCGQ